MKLLDAETVHNWRNRYADTPFGMALPQYVRAAVMDAHDEHHGKGTNARELADQLCEQFPEYLTR